MNRNKLKLNDEKTELLAVGDTRRLSQVSREPLQLGEHHVPFQPSAKYLGVYVDESLSMSQHISHLCRSCFYHLRKIGTIRPFLSEGSTSKLVSSLILSRLDYCNSVLSGLPSTSLQRLQKVQNCAAKVTLRKRKRDHVTPLLKHLHWLPIEARIEYKVATLAFRHFEHSLPPYLSAELQVYQPSRTLRSSNQRLLKIPTTKLKSYGNRSFSYQAPVIWNSLPESLRNSTSLCAFKANLRTYLFNKHLT